MERCCCGLLVLGGSVLHIVLYSLCAVLFFAVELVRRLGTSC